MTHTFEVREGQRIVDGKVRYPNHMHLTLSTADAFDLAMALLRLCKEIRTISHDGQCVSATLIGRLQEDDDAAEGVLPNARL